MIYGIDLGTTFSVIGSGDKLFSGLVSSRVDFDNNCVVEHSNYSNGTYGSYKVDMTTDDFGKKPIEASSIVLKHLKDLVEKETGDVVQDVVISVPAYFNTTQRKAVDVAAIKAGLKLGAVLNEPTAAAYYVSKMKYCTGNSVYVVYDLGGGTFDATVIDSRTGKFRVVATDGLKIGGDNLDNRIVNYLCEKMKIPVVHREKMYNTMKYKATELKHAMQNLFDGCNPDSATKRVEITFEDKDKVEYVYDFSLGEYKELVKEVFGKTVSIVSGLIEGYIKDVKNPKIIFVGGSTHDSFLVLYVLKELGLSVKENAVILDDCDYAVAKGIALFAKAYETDQASIEIQDVTKQFSIEDAAGVSIPIIYANTSIPCCNTVPFENSSETSKLSICVYQGNSAIAKNNDYIGSFTYDYGETYAPGDGKVDISIEVNDSGFVKVKVLDLNTFEEESMELELK